MMNQMNMMNQMKLNENMENMMNNEMNMNSYIDDSIEIHNPKFRIMNKE